MFKLNFLFAIYFLTLFKQEIKDNKTTDACPAYENMVNMWE